MLQQPPLAKMTRYNLFCVLYMLIIVNKNIEYLLYFIYSYEKLKNSQQL